MPEAWARCTGPPTQTWGGRSRSRSFLRHLPETQNGWRGFAPLVGPSNLAAGDYFTSMSSGSYLWSYGCGGGYWYQANGIGTTASAVGRSPLKAPPVTDPYSLTS